MNVNDVQAVGRACPLKHKARRITVRKVHRAPTSLSDFIPRVCALNSQKQERYSLKDIYWKKTTLSFYWVPTPLPMDRIGSLQLLHREKKDLEKCKGGAVREGEV
jgi:hypothetical protein